MITIKDVEHVAKLARLELTEEEKDQKRHELIDMLCAMQDNFNEHKKEQQEHGLS